MGKTSVSVKGSYKTKSGKRASVMKYYYEDNTRVRDNGSSILLPNQRKNEPMVSAAIFA